jgi:predicted phosphoadenosine phosphosulfate sulfurtransferase
VARKERVTAKPIAKQYLAINVLEAAQERIRWTFDTFERVYLSGPSGKDSGVMMHLACAEARRRGRKIGVLYVDLEAQYTCTIDYVREMFALYADVIDPHWVALPLHLRNAVSMQEPYWICWDPDARERWVRQPPPEAITDPERYPFFREPWEAQDGMRSAQEFEEFVELFGQWYSGPQHASTACLVGIRTAESLNRWRAISRARKSRLEGKPWTSWKGGALFNVYPIYDWATEDIWTFHGKTGLPHNPLYDWMHKAGLSIHQQRICQPYGDDQRRSLAMWHVIEPEAWARVVARVTGANYGALYAGKRGNILGNGAVTLPASHPTWKSYVDFLLESLPEYEAEHYRNKIAVFMRWWQEKRGVGMVDEAPYEVESKKKAPTWRRVAKTILLNDRMCRRLSFSQQRSTETAYERYRAIMRKRRAKWGT